METTRPTGDRERAEGDLPSGDWSREDFRSAGYKLVDWMAEYLANSKRYPVLAQVEPGDTRRQLPASPPECPEPFSNLLEDLNHRILPGITHWNHPGFLGYFAITASAPGVLGEMAAAAINTNAMLWRSCPASVELEQQVLGWLAEMVGLPKDLFGEILDTASTSTLCALAAAREACTAVPTRTEGLAAPGAPRLRLYISTEAHSSVEKAALVLGIGQAGVRKIEVDGAFAMSVPALAAAIREDRAAGWAPFAVVATIGTTSTTSVDPVGGIAELCRSESLWLHVDAAYGGSAAILPEKRALFTGWEDADSIVINPHKWLFVPIDLSVLFTRRPDDLRRAFQLVPDYLKTSEMGDAVNLMDYGFQLGRRFRALKLWWTIRSFGVRGIRDRIRTHCALAGRFAEWIDADPRFERMAAVPFSTVCFRGRWPGMSDEETDQANQSLLDRLNARGDVFLSSTRVLGRLVLRIAIGNLRTTDTEVRRAYDLAALEYAR